jgi:hypothetical protein
MYTIDYKGLATNRPFLPPFAGSFETPLALSSKIRSKSLIFLVKIICQVKLF